MTYCLHELDNNFDSLANDELIPDAKRTKAEILVSRIRSKRQSSSTINEEVRSISMEELSVIDEDTVVQQTKKRRVSLAPFMSIAEEIGDQRVFLAPPLKIKRRNLRLKIVRNTYEEEQEEEKIAVEKKDENPRVIINVSGEMYETFERTLARYPGTLLGDVDKRSKYYCPETNVLRFFRSRNMFDAILFFYQSQGKLLCPPNITVEDFIEECYFFELPDEIVFERFKFEINLLREGLKHKRFIELKSIKDKCWNILEKPASSTVASLYFKLSILVTVISVLFACFQTNSIVRRSLEKIHPSGWNISALVFNVFFSVEFMLRILSSPNKNMFMKSLHNWIDFLCVSSYFLLLSLPKEPNLYLSTFAHVFRILKVLCLFRIGKTFKALRLSMTTVKLLKHDYTTLFFCFFMSFFSGATVIFFAEKHREVFNAIPKCFYWAISTVTAVGDGHAIPNTTLGKFVAGSYMVSGILTFTLPTIYIMNKFSPVYQRLHELSLT